MPFLLAEQRAGGWSIDLLCSRNARPEKALVGRAQWEPKRATLPCREKKTNKLGEIIQIDDSRSMRAVKGSLGRSPREMWSIRKCLIDRAGGSPQSSPRSACLAHFAPCPTSDDVLQAGVIFYCEERILRWQLWREGE